MLEFLRELPDKILGPGLFLEALTHIATFVGAISGIRLACVKHFDWFGAYVIGFITTLGGGTLRDVLMNKTPFWMDDPSYLITTFAAVIAVWLFGRRFISEKITWFVFDTIAISIFMVIGMEKVIIDGVDFVVNPRFQGKPTCQPSSIIAFGERGEVEIIRK